jgi:catalase
VPDGAAVKAVLAGNGHAIRCVREAFKHYKTIAATGDGIAFVGLALRDVADSTTAPGLVAGDTAAAVSSVFVDAIAQHRNWDRTSAAGVPV